MSLFVLETIHMQKTSFLKLNHDRAVDLSINFANAANSYVISYSLDGLQKQAAAYKNVPGLQYAIITSDDGIVLAHTDDKLIGLRAVDGISNSIKSVKTTQILVENNRILDVVTPIVNRDKIIGWARIGLSQEYIEPSLAKIRNRGILFIIASLVIGSIVAVVVAGGLSKGLQKLIMTAEKIKGGERDVRAEPSKSRELSELGSAFNHMLDDIVSNEKVLGMILESLPVGVMILDQAGKIESVNPAAKQIWQGIQYVGVNEYSAYKGWFYATGTQLRSEDWGAARVLAGGQPVINEEIQIESFDGSSKVILNSAIPIEDANGGLIHIIIINVDITAVKKAEKELRTTNQEIVERVKELRCLYRMSQLSNDAHKTMKEIIRESVDIIPASYQYPGITCVRITFEGEEFLSNGFCNAQWKQGSKIISRGNTVGDVEVFYTQQMPEEAEGPFLAEERLLIDSIADILGSSAERKKSEETIRQSEADYRRLFNLSPAPMCVIDHDTFRFIQVNEACITAYGYKEEEFLQMTYNDIVFHENEAEISRDVLNQLEQTHTRRSGEQFDVRLSSIPVILNGRKSILVIGIDVTEKNLYEQRLLQASIRTQEEERYEIGSELHDDVGQLLMSSLIFLGGLKKLLPGDSLEKFEETKLYITKAAREIRNLSHRLAPTFLDNTTLKEAFDHLLASFNDGRYQISLQFTDAAKHFPLNKDLQLNLFRILQEQLKNIHKHADATKIEVTIDINSANVLQLSVYDNGVGFDTARNRGGIGMANMHRRVKLFNGNLGMHSVIGSGSRLVVQIPLVHPEQFSNQ
jgi:PAS domain S-box-containing protein